MTKKKYPMPEEFQDPLENYEPREYSDALERALAEETVASIQSRPFASVSPETTVRQALHKLSELHIGCLLIEEEGKLVGIFADRDVLDRVALEFDEVIDQPVSQVMTTDPVYVYESDSAAAALSVMAVSGFRHVPVANLDEKLVGIISPQRVTSFLQEYFEG